MHYPFVRAVVCIDIKLPTTSSLAINAQGNEIMSNLEFNIVSETLVEGAQQMNLKLGKGKVKMILDAGLGNIYLRKK